YILHPNKDEIRVLKRIRNEMKSDREVRTDEMIRNAALVAATNIASSFGSHVSERVVHGKRRK
ncbi:MAG: hypothetical protein CUN57_03185, partial [Phototrophicales bacterium]